MDKDIYTHTEELDELVFGLVHEYASEHGLNISQNSSFVNGVIKIKLKEWEG